MLGIGVDIRVIRVLLQVIGVASDCACLAPLVFGPGIIGRIGNGNDTFTLIVEHVAHIHIQISLIDYRDFRCTVRCQNPAIASAGNLARQIDLAARRVDILYHQFIRSRVPINLGHIVKSLVRAVPLGTAIIDLIHGVILNNSRTAGRPLLRRSQLLLRHRGRISLVATLNKPIHIDVGS